MPRLITITLILAIFTCLSKSQLTSQENIIFEKIRTVSLSRASWRLSYIIDLNSYEKIFSSINDFFHNVNNMASRSQTYQVTVDSTGVYRLPIELLVQRLKMLNTTKNDLNKIFESVRSLQHNFRTKRALLPFMGTIYSKLFGLSTDADLRDTKKAINDMSNNQQTISHVVNSSLTLIQKNREEIQTNRQKLILINNALKHLVIQINSVNNRTTLALQKLTDNLKLY